MCPVVLLQITYENRIQRFEQTNMISLKLKPRYTSILKQIESSHDIAIISWPSSLVFNIVTRLKQAKDTP